MEYKYQVESTIEKLEKAVARLERLESAIVENITRKDYVISKLKNECKEQREAKEKLWEQLKKQK
jgi:uncharacterized protein YbbC (DUF1343 family)